MTALERYRQALPPGELMEFPLVGLDRVGVPVWSATLICADGTFHGVGYGATDEQARTGALGELVESTGVVEGLPRMARQVGTYRELVASLGAQAVLDPLTACLSAGGAYTPDTVLRWVEACRITDDTTVLVPEEFVASHPSELAAGPHLELPITNGLGAGDSRERALAHGLLELVQRDGNCIAFRAMDRGRAITLDGVRAPELQQLLDRVAAHGLVVIPKLAEDDLGIVSVYVVGGEPDPADAPHALMVTACGEGAHPDPETALRKALLEFLSSRVRKIFVHGPLEQAAALAPAAYRQVLERARPLPGEEQELAAVRAWLGCDGAELRARIVDPVLTVHTHVPLSQLPATDPSPEAPADVLAAVMRRFGDAGLDPLWVELSPPGAEVVVARVIVPGLEAETMSYGRIGARNVRRLRERGSDLVRFGKAPPGGRRIMLASDDEECDGPAWLDWPAVERTVGELFALYREPARHVASRPASAG